jgi:hypothetical protein
VHGGLYVDLDFTCLKPLRSMIDGREMVLVLDVKDHNRGVTRASKDNRITIYNGVIGSTPRNPYWLQLMNFIVQRYEPRHRVMENTGPCALGEFAKRFKLDIDHRPDWFVPNWWVLPISAPPAPKQQPTTSRVAGQQDDGPYLRTRWQDGTGWGSGWDEKLRLVNHYLCGEDYFGLIAVFVLLALLLLSVVVNAVLGVLLVKAKKDVKAEVNEKPGQLQLLLNSS